MQQIRYSRRILMIHLAFQNFFMAVSVNLFATSRADKNLSLDDS